MGGDLEEGGDDVRLAMDNGDEAGSEYGRKRADALDAELLNIGPHPPPAEPLAATAAATAAVESSPAAAAAW